jgi:hypothetical protein
MLLQKYREFYEEFQDVGLMTGDVTINPGAACLVMTTEILRSMLYNGSEVVREVRDLALCADDVECSGPWENYRLMMCLRLYGIPIASLVGRALQA